MHLLEPIGKAAAIVSTLAIVFLQLAFHPDMTPLLRVLMLAALIAGWLGARALPRSNHALWVMLAILSPGPLSRLSGREGSVLDLFWMAGLTASLLRTSSWTQWSIPIAGWRVLTAGWALTLALAWPVIVGREIGFDIARLTDRGAINSWALLSAPQVVAWTAYVVWTQLLGVLWLDWLAARWTTAADETPSAAHGFWIGTTISSLVAIYQGTIDTAFLSTPFWTALARSPGTMLDPNAFGMCAALAGPVAILALYGRIQGAWLGAILVVNLAGVWMSGSRAASLCALIATAGIAVGLWRTSRAHATRLIPVASAGAVALVLVIWLADAVGPVRRFAELFAQPEAALGTALNRGPYGTTADQIIRDYPVTGAGIGAYQIVSADYWHRVRSDVLRFDTAQNWWRHQATELGLLGGLTLFALSMAIAWRVVTAHDRPGRALQATILRGLLLAVGICSFIQFLTQTPVVLLSFFLFVAWLGAVTSGRADNAPHPGWLRFARVAVALLAVAYAASHAVLARGALSVEERARRERRPFLVGTYPVERLPDSGEFRWTRNRAHLVLPARTPWVVVRLWAAHPDIAKTSVRVTLTTPCGVLFTAELRDHDPVSFGVILPEETSTFDARVDVSRTWQPADYGGGDTRRLGVALVAEFVDSRELALTQKQTATWPACATTR